MKKSLVLTAVALLSLGTVASASGTSTGGTLQLTGDVEGSIALQIRTSDVNPITLSSGANTKDAGATIAAVSYYGTADNTSVSGFTKTSDSTNIILTGNFDVQVDQANTGTTSYTLTAALQGSDTLTWTLDGTTLSTSDSAPLSVTAAYGARATQTLVIKVPTDHASGTSAISNTIVLTAVAGGVA